MYLNLARLLPAFGVNLLLYGKLYWTRGVAQLGSAPALGAGGRKFESCRPDHYQFLANCFNGMNIADFYLQPTSDEKTALLSDLLPWGPAKSGFGDGCRMIDSESSSYMALEALVQSVVLSQRAAAGWISLKMGRGFIVVGSVGFPFPSFLEIGSPESKAILHRGITKEVRPKWKDSQANEYPNSSSSVHLGCFLETQSGIKGVLSLLFADEVDANLASESAIVSAAASARFCIEAAESAAQVRSRVHEAVDQNKRLLRRLQDLELSNTDLQVTKGALETKNLELRDLADLDGATGLLNQRAFYQELSAKVQSGAQTAVAIIDVDNFKAYNDQFGHLAGDEVLRRLGNLLREECGLDSLAARYGGEEFAIIFGPRSAENALDVTNHIRQMAEDMEWPNRDITFTAGVAKNNRLIQDAKELVHRADQALYVGKRSGKNKVLAWE